MWGSAGVGKTALTLHWAHRVAPRFLDGQLYINLRGFDFAGSVVPPVEALGGFLDALGVPPEEVPAGLDGQAALYRSLLADKHVLVVLDNARDAEQIRPLLPGSGSCLVIVTSREQLGGLVALDGAQPLTLDLLPPADARRLLISRVGPQRVDAEPDAVDEIIRLCAGLPLALAIVAARAATHPRFALSTLAGELDACGNRLDALVGDDQATDVRTVLSWSYHAVSPQAARLFRLLGLHFGPDISAIAAASLAGLPLSQAQPVLTELARAHLITEHAPGRYVLHDLLRAYAAEQADSTDTESERRAAVHRLLDYYLHSARTAALLLDPARDPVTIAAPRPGVTPEHPPGHAHALVWFSAEHTVLLAAVDHAANSGFDTHAWQLSWALIDYLRRRWHRHDAVRVGRAVVAAATRSANPCAQVRARRYLAVAYRSLGRLDEAHAQLRDALTLCNQMGDAELQADINLHLGLTFAQEGRYTDALQHAQRALGLYRAAGHPRGTAFALNAVGDFHAELGEHEAALEFCEQALTLHHNVGDRDGEAGTWTSLGSAHHDLGHHAHAITCYEMATALYHDVGDRNSEAETLAHLGDAFFAAGNTHSARRSWQSALATLDDIGNPYAEQVRKKLREIDDDAASEIKPLGHSELGRAHNRASAERIAEVERSGK